VVVEGDELAPAEVVVRKERAEDIDHGVEIAEPWKTQTKSFLEVGDYLLGAPLLLPTLRRNILQIGFVISVDLRISFVESGVSVVEAQNRYRRPKYSVKCKVVH